MNEVFQAYCVDGRRLLCQARAGSATIKIFPEVKGEGLQRDSSYSPLETKTLLS